MKSVGELRRIIEPAVQARGYELVQCLCERQNQKTILRVFIDSEQGVTLDACAKVSRQISSVLEVEDPGMGAYDLEVSSPGLDRPLLTLANYQRFIGKRVALKLRMPIENRRNFKGVIQEVMGNEIVLTLEEGGSLKVNFNDIEKANLEPTF